MPLRIGETFAGYRILRLLGSGGMGEVYLVQHPRLPRQEALKVLRPDISGDACFRERFIREADLASGLRHPHIVAIHDRGEHEGHLWIAMDYIDGTDAAHLLEQKYPAGMPIDIVVSITVAVASALDYAHKKGLLHRDVKPANIIVADTAGDDLSVFLADFGIARPIDDTSGITTTNTTVGTVAYAAPEQLMGEPIDGRADQYALAASTYHLLTGTHLFPNSNPAVVISHHLNAPPPLLGALQPGLASLDPVLAAALAKKPDDRFACSTDFARAVTETAAPQTLRPAAAPTTPAPAARSPYLKPETAAARAHPPTLRLTGISVAAVLLLLGVIGMLWRPWQHPQTVTSAISSSNTPTTFTPTAAPPPPPNRTTAAPQPPSTGTPKAPTVNRTPTAPTAGDELPHIDGADWAGYNKAMDQGMSPDGVKTMTGIVWTDSAAWVCDWHEQGVDQSAVANRLVDKYDGLSYDDANVIYRSAMDWVCPVTVPSPPPTATITATPPKTAKPAPAPEPADPATWICDSIKAGNPPGKAIAAAQDRFGITQADAFVAYSNCT